NSPMIWLSWKRRIFTSLWVLGLAAFPHHRITRARRVNGRIESRVATPRRVNAVWVDEVPLVIRRVAAGTEQMEVGIDAASPLPGRLIVGAATTARSGAAGMSDGGAGGNLLVEERHIDLVRVGPPEVGIRVVRSAFGTSGFL